MTTLPLDRESLVRAIAKGQEFEYLLFYGSAAKHPEVVDDAVFSQWYSHPFTVDGVVYPTAEHWMMAGKARLFKDDAALSAILAAGSPAQAKALGREVQNFSESVWKQERFKLVTQGNVYKFGSDAPLRAHLLGTGETILVEASPRDTIWGIGLGANNTMATNPSRWRGSNLLGFALVAARSRLREVTTS